jgi:hypothetical protein
VSGNGVLFSTLAGLPLAVSSQFDSVAASNTGPPAVGNGFFAWGTTDETLSRVSFDGGVPLGSVSAVSTPGAVSFQARTPILGEASLAYFIGNSGSLYVRRQASPAEEWTASLATPVSEISQPALDVYRTATGAKDCSKSLGVLYVLTKSGATATLRAILVDSQGLDSAAPWPKYQRDKPNTGNVSLPLDAWVCLPVMECRWWPR